MFAFRGSKLSSLPHARRLCGRGVGGSEVTTSSIVPSHVNTCEELSGIFILVALYLRYSLTFM